MANMVISIVLLVLLCGSAYGKRWDVFPAKSGDVVAALAPLASDGICKTLVEINGYDCEEHTVTTQDGFILGLQKVTKGQSGGSPGNNVPVLLQHGILMDGAVWVMLPPGKSLAFSLADDGYEVWLGNARGTKSSSGHTSLTPDDLAFWDWSWDELAGFDLPATFQYVFNQTGQKMHYVGHSSGTLTALASFSKDLLTDMMRSAALLGPVAYLGQTTSPLSRAAADILTANESYWLGLGEFNPAGDAGTTLINAACNTTGVDCSDILSSFTGPNCCLDTSLVNVFLSHGPQSTATKNLIHQSQMIKKGTLTMYDYENEDENKKHYGQPTPPAYDITKIPNNIPLFLGCGGKDALSDPKDVQQLLDGLKDHLKDKLVVQEIDNYAHADFMFATNAKETIYDPVMAFIKLY